MFQCDRERKVSDLDFYDHRGSFIPLFPNLSHDIPDIQNTPDCWSRIGNGCGVESFEIEMFWLSGFRSVQV